MNIFEMYKSKLKTAEEIVDCIEDGWVCAMDIGAAIPSHLSDTIAKASKAGKFKDLKMHMYLDIYPLDILKEEFQAGIRPISWFSGGGLRACVNAGVADVMPGYYRDFPALLDKYIDLDAVYLHVSPMDKHGYFSMPVAGSVSEVLLKKAKRLYLQVNKNMPRSLYSPLIHISMVDGLCEKDESLPVLPPTKIDKTSEIIGGYIAEQIPDGATLQLGIGAVPEAVGLALKNKKKLGIHTELLTDSMIELIECGAVTNELKPIYRGKTVATLAFGSQRMYDFIDDNRAFVLLPVNEVNDPAVVSLHPNFMSVNAGLEVDFFGQVCAESLGTKHISGSGGQADFVRGAIQSPGGKSFIAMPSTAMGGKVSRIKPTLTEGAIVTTHKNDVDYIVTEFGIAKLRGKTLGERTKALIAIAHPDFREELTDQAKRRKIIL